MIQILTHDTKGTTGWRIDGAQVFSEGRWRHPNGMWSVTDEVHFEDAADVFEDLEEEDAQALLNELDAREERARLHTELAREQERQAQENARIAREKITAIHDRKEAAKISDARELFEKLRSLPAEETLEVECADGRKRSFARNHRGPCVVFFKKGGYVPWMLPCTESQAAGLIAGTKKVVYWKRTNRALIESVTV